MSRGDSIRKLIEKTGSPRTRESLATDLRSMGLDAGDTVIVHSSLSSLGWVNGGAVAVVQALCDAVTADGTIVMPAHSYNYTDPAGWQDSPVPDAWVVTLRETLPAFEPGLAPTTRMGQIVEVFRSLPGAIRSRHPVTSFAAWGRHARSVTEGHTYENGQGEGSPLARVYELDGKILLLGVGYDRNTSFHLAEYRVAETVRLRKLLPVPEEGRVVWREVDESSFMRDAWLSELGEAFEAAGHARVGQVGSAETRLLSQREAVDFAVGWLRQRYRETGSGSDQG